jgi:hypothetical protein
MGWMHEECLIRDVTHNAFGWQWKTVSKKNGQDSEPWEGFLKASLKIEQMRPPVVEFTDLRGDSVGDVKIWTESVKCLLCGTTTP